MPRSATRTLGAHTEAIAELARALDLLVHLPEGPEREQTELMVRELRSFSAVMAAGYAAPEAAEDHGRCVELCEGFGLPPELLPSLIRSWSFYAFRGEIADAERVCDAMEQVASTGALAFPAEAIGRGLHRVLPRQLRRGPPPDGVVRRGPVGRHAGLGHRRNGRCPTMRWRRSTATSS